MALDNFISQIKSGGLARTNRFTVQFELPPTVRKSKGSNNLRKILLFCDSAQLPGIIYRLPSLEFLVNLEKCHMRGYLILYHYPST